MEKTKQKKYDELYMDIAIRVGLMSHDPKYKVGSVIVKDGNVISMGWNGMPKHMDNETRCASGCTHPEVLHSEANALMKLIKSGTAAEGATIYCTLSPCMDCAKLIYQAGISRVVYAEKYDTPAGDKGALFLLGRKIDFERIKPSGRVSTDESQKD